jgi:O-antigen ligase
VLGSPAEIRSRFWHRRDLLLYLLAAVLGLIAAYSRLKDPALVKPLLLLPGLVLAFTIPVEALFVAWLFCAPLVQGPSGGTDPHHIFFKLFFLFPPLILVARMATGAMRRPRLWAIDALPALYLLYVIVRVELLPSSFSGTDASLRGIYTTIGVGIVCYYVAAFAATSDRFPEKVAKSLLWSGIVVAALGVVDAATGWNLWKATEVGAGTQTRRAVSTFPSAGALGAYLGACMVIAVATLAWKGPRTLRLPAVLVIVLSLPAMFFTYSRGPVLGAGLVVVVMALVANRVRWPSLLVFATVVLLIAVAWGRISSSAAYHQRLGVTETVHTRNEIQRVSLDLFRQKVVFGWGYDTFDKAKLTVSSRDPRFDQLTSHNTFLTVLVELGVVGLVLLVLPWFAIGWRAISDAWHSNAERWIIAGSVGAASAYALGALTYDSRFFSLITALPWIGLGLARSVLARQHGSVEPVHS